MVLVPVGQLPGIAGMGTLLDATPEAIGAVQQSILAGNCVEFDYTPLDGSEAKGRRVIPYGLSHGPTTYLVGKMPLRVELQAPDGTLVHALQRGA